MALLSDADRADVTAKIQRLGEWLGIPCGITKADLRTGVNDTDVWIDTNQASYNLALTLAVRNGINTVQKTIMFCLVAMKRAGIL